VIETLIILFLLWAAIKIIELVLNPDKFLSWWYRGHFSTLKTKMTDVEVLVSALQELGFSVEMDAQMRGGNKPRRADVVAVLEGDCDLGWIIDTNNTDGTFNLVVDILGVSRYYNQAILINSIFDKYQEIEAGRDALP
jgi:Protein of unknown function (DUF1257)